MFKDSKLFSLNGGTMIQPLNETWGYDLHQTWGDPMKWKVGAWNSSFYHCCLNSNMPLRCDYIKNINKYYDMPTSPAQRQRGDMVDETGRHVPGCWHCGKIMPVKFVRLFQAFFLGERLRVVRKKVFIDIETRGVPL